MVKQATETDQPFIDYYQILHLHAEADAPMVDQAYWHLARIYNAAIRSDSSAKTKLEELNEAYSVLRSPGLRRKYDQARNAVPSEGALPDSLEQEQEELPLAVMAKQRPKPRKQAGAKPARRRWLSIQHLSIPPWQSVVGALVIVVLAGAALATGAEPAWIVGLVIVGIAFTLVPLVRKLPRLTALPSPTLHLPTIRAPRLPNSPATRPGLNPDTLRQSTEAMRNRWRAGTEGLSMSDPTEPPRQEDPPTGDGPATGAAHDGPPTADGPATGAPHDGPVPRP